MKILNLSFSKVNPPMCGGHLRIRDFNIALSNHENIMIEQFSYNIRFFTLKRKIEINGSKYIENVLSSFLYSAAAVIVHIVFRIKSWLFIIPLIFNFIFPNKQLKKALNNVDLIQVEGPWLVPWIKKYSSKPLVVVAHNIEYYMSVSIFKHKKINNFLKRIILNVVHDLEKNAFEKSELILAVSNEDKKIIMDLYNIDNKKILVTPNGINMDSFKPIYCMDKDEARKKIGIGKYKHVILFAGSFHPPNRIAADFIINRLVPFFSDDILFLISGSVFSKFNKNKNVFCTGLVDRKFMEYCFSASDIAVNPVTYGSGSNIKIFEYLASGLPVVSTVIGARGLSNAIKEPAVTITDLEGFHGAIKDLLLKDREVLKRKASKAATYHDYKNITSDVINLFEYLIS